MSKMFLCLTMVLFLATVTGCDDEKKKAAEQKINNLQSQLDSTDAKLSALRSELESKNSSINALEHQVISERESRYSWVVIASVVFLVIGVTIAAKTHRKFKQQRYAYGVREDTETSPVVH